MDSILKESNPTVRFWTFRANPVVTPFGVPRVLGPQESPGLVPGLVPGIQGFWGLGILKPWAPKKTTALCDGVCRVRFLKW